MGKADVNEVLLLHGTTPEKAEHIAAQGFDERLAELDGHGIYFSAEACKAAQYCGDSGCIIVARVVLGHPFLAKGPMPTHRSAPEVEDGSGQQSHSGFVVPCADSQAYPELIIRFTR